jgi:hypothetical protein
MQTILKTADTENESSSERLFVGRALNKRYGGLHVCVMST